MLYGLSGGAGTWEQTRLEKDRSALLWDLTDLNSSFLGFQMFSSCPWSWRHETQPGSLNPAKVLGQHFLYYKVSLAAPGAVALLLPQEWGLGATLDKNRYRRIEMVLWKCLLSAQEQSKGKLTVKNYYENNGEQIIVMPLNRSIVETALWLPYAVLVCLSRKIRVGRVSEKSNKQDQIQRISSIWGKSRKSL